MVDIVDDTKAHVRPERRPQRWQFTLLSVLLVFTLPVAPCHWLAVQIQYAERQKAAVAALERAHASVRYEGDGLVTDGIDSAPPPKPPTVESRLRELGTHYFGHVRAVEFPGRVSDAEVAPVKEIPSLVSLTFEWTNVSDAALVHVAHVSNLGYLTTGPPATASAAAVPRSRSARPTTARSP